MPVSHETIASHQERFVLPTYAPELTLVRGAMSRVWDSEGAEYLDFVTGISVCNLGHCHPVVTEAIQRQAARLVHVSNLYFNENQPQLAERIARHSFGGRVFFCNSGAEANEGLIKFARRWGSASGKYEIICLEDSFHGRTLATLAATGRAKYRQGFAPDVQGFVHVPINDLHALREAYNERTVAVLLEPLQGEGGIVPCDSEYMVAVRNFCDENGLLMLVDEVQCGMGRTGTYFAYQHFGIEPDGMAMAKALGNGVPLGAFEVRQDYTEVLPPGTHATTFGGSPLACAAGLAVFQVLEQDNVLDNVVKMSARIRNRLVAMKQQFPALGEIRGLGLMIGVRMPDMDTVKATIAACRRRGLLVLPAGNDVLRMLPPLTVEPDEIDQAMDILAESFAGVL